MDNFKYVDAMSNRMNDTDARLLRASIGERPGPKGQTPGDFESQMQNAAFTNEQFQTNQEYTKKVKFSPAVTGPPGRKNKLDAAGKTNMVTNMTVVNKNETSNARNSSQDASGRRKGSNKVGIADDTMLAGKQDDKRHSTQIAIDPGHSDDEKDAMMTIGDGYGIDDGYMYRGPQNSTGIFKNSLILKDLTGYLEGVQRDRADANTQTIAD